jgi:hypothetical protein
VFLFLTITLPAVVAVVACAGMELSPANVAFALVVGLVAYAIWIDWVWSYLENHSQRLRGRTLSAFRGRMWP